MKISHTLIRAGIALAGLLLGASPSHAVDATASADIANRQSQETTWYVQGLLGSALSSDQGVTVHLGGPVSLQGVATYASGGVYSVAVGKQWLGSRHRDEKENQQTSDRCPQADHQVSDAEPRRITEKDQDCLPWRAEVEFWAGDAKRESIAIGALHVKPGDTVRTSVLFLNGAFRLTESDELKKNLLPTWRTWLAAGVGYARINNPGVTALSGCGCLAAVSDSGLALQLKLLVERQISDSALLVFQAGHIWLPKINTVAGVFPQTLWQDRGVNQLMVGLRYTFR